MKGGLFLLKIMIDLNLLSEAKAREVWQEYKSSLGQKPSLSLPDFLQSRYRLPPSTLDRLEVLAARGYAFCTECSYLSPDAKKSPSKCPQCQGKLRSVPSRAESSSLEEKATLAEDDHLTPSPRPSSSRREKSSVLESKEVARYPILGVLGQGGYGTVYEVCDPLTNRKMALKVIKSGQVHFSFQKRFLREVKITSRLEHPHIMPLYESGHLQDGSLYFVMKKLKGGTLKDILSRREKGEETSLKDLLEIFLKVCQAVEYAHSQGVIHRDLKPSNVAVGEFGEVMVLDWGIARYMDESDEILEEETQKIDEIETGKGQEDLTGKSMLGTPGYMSPEQSEGKGVDERSDVYGLGAILYEILTGKQTFAGGARQKILKALMESPIPPHKRRPSFAIPKELSAIATKALEKKPTLRYQSVRQLREDILRFQEGYSVRAQKESWRRRMWKWIKRNRALSLGAGAAVIVALVSVALVFYLFHSAREEKIENYLHQASQELNHEEIYSARALQEKYPHQYATPGQEGKEARRRRIRSLNSYLQARRLLEGAWELDRGSDEIRQRLFEMEREIGLLALLGKNYLWSESSFERCIDLGYEREGKELLAQLKRRKGILIEKERERVRKIMETLAKEDPARGMMEEYVTEIVRLGGRHLARMLVPYINGDNEWQRLVAIRALGKLGYPNLEVEGKTVATWLVGRLKEKKGETSLETEALIWALGRLKVSRATKLIYQIRLQSTRGSPFWNRTKVPFDWLPISSELESENQKETGPEKLYQKAMFYFEKGHTEKALELLQKIARQYSRSSAVFNDLGGIYLKKGYYQKALEAFSRAIELLPSNALAYSNRGYTYYSLRKLDLALRDLKKATELKKENHSAWNYLAQLWARQGKYQKAIQCHKKAIEQAPHIANYYTLLGITYANMNRLTQATEAFQRAIKRDPKDLSPRINLALIEVKKGNSKKGAERLNSLRQQDPKNPQIFTFLARIYYLEKEYKKALRASRKAIPLYSNDMDGKELLSRTYSLQARSLYRLGHVEEAFKACTQSIKSNPYQPSAFQLRGMIYFRKKDFRRAIRDFSRALKLAEKAQIYALRGKSYLALKKYNQALRDGQKALELDSNNGLACILLGSIYNLKGNSDKALKFYNRAAKVLPNYQKVFNHRGTLYYKKGLYNRALRDFTRAIHLDKSDRESRLSRAYCWEFKGDYSRALADYNYYINHYPPFAKAFLSRGELYFKLKKYDLALADYKKALQIKPDLHVLYYNLGVLYISDGKRAKGVEALRKFINRTPRAPQAPRARMYIRKYGK